MGEAKMNIVDENNKENMVTQGTTTAVMSSYFHSAYIAMLPWFFVAIPLIILDLRLGRKKARKIGEDVTINKSIRMTIDKTFSYICWIMLSATLSLAFETASIKFIIMGVIYLLEVWSSFGKWLFCTYDIKVNDAEMLRIAARWLWNKITGMDADFRKVFNELQEQKEEKRNGKRRETRTVPAEMGDGCDTESE